MTRKICIVTGTRAEYGLLRWVIEGVKSCDGLVLQLLVTGAHLSPEFGLTYRDIERDGYIIDAKVEMLLSTDTATGVAKAMGLGLIGMSDALERSRPDLLVVLGDRFEMFAATTAALILGIPVAHLHGGEATEGAFDEAIRHAITKMSHLHFVAAEEYQHRVIQLGEHPDRVFLVGGLGIDARKHIALLDRSALERALNLTLRTKNLLVTFHPATLEGGSASWQTTELLAALGAQNDTQLIFTMPNADTGGREVARQIEEFVASHPNAVVYRSLGQVLYMSCMKQVDGVVGNSSSGITEAPSFGIGTVNIGDRQRGRLKAESVIDCEPQRDAIATALRQLTSADFRQKLARGVKNPYGNGGASEKIVKILRDFPLENILKKSFNDLRIST